MTFLSVFFYTIYNFIFTLIENDIEGATVLGTRGFLQVAIMGSCVWGCEKDLKPAKLDEDTNARVVQEEERGCCSRIFYSYFIPKHWVTRAILLQIFASSVAGFRLGCLFQALKSSSLGTTNAIMNGSPLIVMVIGHFFMEDKFTKVRCISACCLALGLCLNALPTNVTDMTSLQPKDLIELEGAGMAIFTMFLSALGTCLFKPLTSRFDKIVISFYYGMAILIVGVIQLIWVSFDEPEKDDLPILPLDPRIWVVVTIVGIFGVIQQLCVIAAVKKGSPVTVTMIRTTGIVFSFLLQTQNNEGLPSISSIFGAMVISGAVFLMTFETRINEKLESSKCRRRHQQNEDQQSNIIQSPCSSILKQSIA